jgi:hypothetical protein
VNSSRDRPPGRKSPPCGKSSRRMCASPAHVMTATPAGEELVKLSVKLTSEEHLRLMQLGLRSRPRRSNQEMLREAVLKYLDAEEEDDVSREGRTS